MPNDETTAKIQRLWRDALVPKWDIVLAVQLLAEVNWSTILVEQSHGSIATVQKSHRLYSADVLSRHAFCHRVAILFRQPVDSTLKGLENNVTKLAKKTPGRFNGKDLFIQECFAGAKQRVPEGERGQSFATQVMTQANRRWGSPPASSKSTWNSRAAKEASEYVNEHREKLLDADKKFADGSCRQRSCTWKRRECPD